MATYTMSWLTSQHNTHVRRLNMAKTEAEIQSLIDAGAEIVKKVIVFIGKIKGNEMKVEQPKA
jgi:hypothetical protein